MAMDPNSGKFEALTEARRELKERELADKLRDADMGASHGVLAGMIDKARAGRDLDDAQQTIVTPQKGRGSTVRDTPCLAPPTFPCPYGGCQGCQHDDHEGERLREFRAGGPDPGEALTEAQQSLVADQGDETGYEAQTRALHEKLEAISTAPTHRRMAWVPGDLFRPEDAVWNVEKEYWEESDASLRARITCELKDRERRKALEACVADELIQETAFAMAIQRALRELGIPGPDYPAPVANAYAILRRAILEPEPVRPNGEPVPADWPVYQVGEEFDLRGHMFRVGAIEENHLLLEPTRRRAGLSPAELAGAPVLMDVINQVLGRYHGPEEQVDPADAPLEVGVDDGVLMIAIGVNTLARSAERCDVTIADPAVFAEEVAEECGRLGRKFSTPIMRMFDEAITKAIDGGADGIDRGEPQGGEPDGQDDAS